MARMTLGEKSLVVAMDHARMSGPLVGLEEPEKALDRLLDAGIDGLMTTYGIVKRYGDRLRGRLPIYLRLDAGPSSYREDWLGYTEWSLLHTVEDARALGVDGVCLMIYVGSVVELKSVEIVARVVGDCAADGLPVMVESLPCPGPRIPDARDPQALVAAARIAFEHGADIVKTYYTGTPESFRVVTRSCPVPVMIAGGTRMNTFKDVLEVVHGAMAGGGKGIVFGRNIWQSRDPAAMVASIKAIIGGASVKEALANAPAGM